MQSFIRRKEGRKERKAGLTLIEIGIVIAVFALILIGILTALGVANQSRELTGLNGDLSNIRSAITKWSAGGPVWIQSFKQSGVPTTGGGVTTITVMPELSNFSEIAVLLPTPLRGAAQVSMSTLTGVNPWGGDYVLMTGGSGSPWTYSIQVTKIEQGLIPVLQNQLSRGDGTVKQGANSLTITYQN